MSSKVCLTLLHDDDIHLVSTVGLSPDLCVKQYAGVKRRDEIDKTKVVWKAAALPASAGGVSQDPSPPNGNHFQARQKNEYLDHDRSWVQACQLTSSYWPTTCSVVDEHICILGSSKYFVFNSRRSPAIKKRTSVWRRGCW